VTRVPSSSSHSYSDFDFYPSDLVGLSFVEFGVALDLAAVVSLLVECFLDDVELTL
jgi:hypothetical protein